MKRLAASALAVCGVAAPNFNFSFALGSDGSTKKRGVADLLRVVKENRERSLPPTTPASAVAVKRLVFHFFELFALLLGQDAFQGRAVLLARFA